MDKGSEVDRPGGLYQVGLRPKEGGLAAAGPKPMGQGVSLFLLLFCLFCIFFLLFIFSSVLIQFKIFMHFIKLCLLHHNYLCNI